MDKSKWKLIENEGALFRGPSRNVPREVWSVEDQCWTEYADTKAKPYEWGSDISEADAEDFKK